MASWLVCPSPDRAAPVRDLAGDIELCSLARPFTPRVLLSTQAYEWVLTNFNAGDSPALDWHPIDPRGGGGGGGVEIGGVASHYGNWSILRSDGPLGLYADYLSLFLIVDYLLS